MLYIVHIAVANDRNDEWFRWMRDVHIDDVLETGCFCDATMVRDPEADDVDHTAYRVLYRAHSDGAFRRYQAEHAKRLQEDHTSRFGDVIRARRELLPIIIRCTAKSSSEA